MGQFVGCITGIAEACRALDFPVVSGNVSLYNETKGDDGSSLAILPTPAIGGVGLLEDWEKSATTGFKNDGDMILVVGMDPATDRCSGQLEQSLWLKDVHGRSAGRAPRVDLAEELANGTFVRCMIGRGIITAVHDISDGGLLVALAEMALAGSIGAEIDYDYSCVPATGLWFGEDQGQYVLTVASSDYASFLSECERSGVKSCYLGFVDGDSIRTQTADRPFPFRFSVSLADLRAAHEGFFPRLMGADAALA
jgi:phosphoribosylformylglycinamidine (FGAM) synthase-like enzyme